MILINTPLDLLTLPTTSRDINSVWGKAFHVLGQTAALACMIAAVCAVVNYKTLGILTSSFNNLSYTFLDTFLLTLSHTLYTPFFTHLTHPSPHALSHSPFLTRPYSSFLTRPFSLAPIQYKRHN